MHRGIWAAAGVLAASLVAPGGVLAQPGQPSPVVVARVLQQELAAGQTFVGTVQPAKRSAVGSAVDGRVVEYPIDVGDRVRKGQALCQLLTETINLQIAAAQAEFRLREEELRELQNGSRPEEVAQAKARMESAAALRDFAEGRYKRAVQLSQQGRTITQEQLEESLSASVDAARKLQAEELAYKLLVQGPREEKIAQAKARLEAQQELVRQLQDQLKKHTMISPFDGYVVAEMTEVGEWVTRGQVVAEVVHLDQIEIEAHVLDAHIDYVRTGAQARVEVPALKQPLFVGAVAHVSPQADVKSRTFPVKVRVENTIREDGPVLKAGMLARVTLPVGAVHTALLVPKDAIVFGGPAPVVYVVGPLPAPPPGGAAAPAGKAAAGAKAAGAGAPASEGPTPEAAFAKPVELGVADGNWVEVHADIKAGDRVVIVGNERLRDKAPVRVVKEQPAPETADGRPAAR